MSMDDASEVLKCCCKEMIGDEMDFEELLSLLDSSTITEENIFDASYRFSGVSRISSTSRSALSEEDVLCFVRASRLNLVPESHLGRKGLMILLDEPIKPLAKKTNRACFSDPDAWLNAIDVVSDEFRTLRRKRDQLLEVAAKAGSGFNPTALLNKLTEIIEAPCSVLDNSLSMLAHTESLASAAGFDPIVYNQLPDDAIALLKEIGLVNPRASKDLTVFSFRSPRNKEVEVFNHFSVVHSGNARIGSISFFSIGKPLRRSRADMIPLAAKIVSVEMQAGDTYMLSKGSYYSYMFKQIEEGVLKDDNTTIARKLSMFGYQLKPYLHVVVIDLTREHLAIGQGAVLAERLHPAIKNSVYVVRDFEIVFLASLDTPRSADFCDVEQLESAISGSELGIGVSGVFSLTRRLAQAEDEARRAIALGRKLVKGGSVWAFDDLRIDDLLANVSDSQLLYSYRHPSVMELIRLDAKNDTSLALTLYEYLRNPIDPTTVARTLSIHKNTLYYRLDKIRDVFGCDIRDGQIVAEVMLTFHVLKAQGRFEELVLHTKPIRTMEESLIMEHLANEDMVV